MDWFYPQMFKMSKNLIRTLRKTIITTLIQKASKKDLVKMINLLRKHLKISRQMLNNVKQMSKNYKRKYKNKKYRDKMINS
jgi:hypothetical protein